MEANSNLKIDSKVYKRFSAYARSRGFTVKKLCEYIIDDCISCDLARDIVSRMLSEKSATRSRPAPSLSATLDKLSIKEDIDELTKITGASDPEFDIENFLENDQNG